MKRRRWSIPLLVTALLSGCSGQPAQTPREIAPTGVAPVIAEFRAITSVVVVDGIVEANPVYTVNAAAAGAVEYTGEGMSDLTLTAETLLAKTGQEPVVLPSDGVIVERSHANGEQVILGSPLASVKYTGFGIAIRVPPELLYRMYAAPVTAKANVSAGPSGLDCRLAPIAGISSTPEGATARDAGTVGIGCLLPLDAKVVAGLPAKVGVETATKPNALSLPLSAVSGSVDIGEVTRVLNGKHVLTAVTLGITDGAYVEITSGLQEGDIVLPFAPGLN